MSDDLPKPTALGRGAPRGEYLVGDDEGQGQGTFFGKGVGTLSRHDPSEVNRGLRMKAAQTIDQTGSGVADILYSTEVPYRHLSDMAESGLRSFVKPDPESDTRGRYSPAHHAMVFSEESPRPRSVVHELGHALHLRGDARWLLSTTPPISEGVADGYADRYTRYAKTYDDVIGPKDAQSPYPVHFNVPHDGEPITEKKPGLYAAARYHTRAEGEVPHVKQLQHAADFVSSPHLSGRQMAPFTQLAHESKASITKAKANIVATQMFGRSVTDLSQGTLF
jgi:hypothetical protein